MISVGIAHLKAHFSEYLRQAKQGEIVAVLDRGQVVAHISASATSMNGLVVRPPRGSLRELKPMPRADVDFDIVEELLKDRDRERRWSISTLR